MFWFSSTLKILRYLWLLISSSVSLWSEYILFVISIVLSSLGFCFFYTEHGPPWEHPVCHEHVPPVARCGVLQGHLSRQSLKAQLDRQLQLWIYPPLCSIRFCFVCFEALLGDVCTSGADVSSWRIDRFTFTQCPSYPSHRLVRKPPSSDITVVTPAWFRSVLTWRIFFRQPAKSIRFHVGVLLAAQIDLAFFSTLTVSYF